MKFINLLRKELGFRQSDLWCGLGIGARIEDTENAPPCQDDGSIVQRLFQGIVPRPIQELNTHLEKHSTVSLDTLTYSVANLSMVMESPAIMGTRS